MDLVKIQKKLSNYIYNYNIEDKDLEEILIGKYLRKPSSRSLHIYRRNILFHVIDIMGDSYKATKTLLGKENFNFFTREYLQQYPPQTINIDEYGERFPSFLSDREDLKADAPYIGEIASLDYFWANAKKEGEEINLVKGSFDIWRIFFNGEAAKEELKIDYQNTETVISTWVERELFLTKKESKI